VSVALAAWFWLWACGLCVGGDPVVGGPARRAALECVARRIDASK